MNKLHAMCAILMPLILAGCGGSPSSDPAPIFAPLLSSTSPVDDSTAVAKDSNIVLTFNKSVSPVSGKNLVIYKSSDNSLVAVIGAASAQVSIVGGVVTINPSADLDNGTAYYVLVDAGAFRDVAGNPYTGIISSTALNFSTVAAAPPALTIADAQGIWRSTVGAATSVSTVVLPDGTTWSLMGDATNTRLLKGSMAVQTTSLAGSGKSYTLGTSTIDSVTLAASVVAKARLIGGITAAPAAVENFNLDYQTRYDTAANLTDFTGSWSSKVRGIAVSWTVTAGASNDTITGTSTTGCTYAGTFSLRAESKTIVDARLNETCGSVLKQFTGVALRSDTITASVTTPGVVVMLTSAVAPDEALALNLLK